MIIRVLTDTNFMDIELKDKVDEKRLIEAIDNSSTLLLETKNDTKMFINTINVVAIEIIDTPPISNK